MDIVMTVELYWMVAQALIIDRQTSFIEKFNRGRDPAKW
jgi:hypothetical protein